MKEELRAMDRGSLETLAEMLQLQAEDSNERARRAETALKKQNEMMSGIITMRKEFDKLEEENRNLVSIIGYLASIYSGGRINLNANDVKSSDIESSISIEKSENMTGDPLLEITVKKL